MGETSERKLSAFAARLGISTPTLRNWRRTGVIDEPADSEFWSAKEQRRIIRQLAAEGRLTSGANRLLLNRRASSPSPLPATRADGEALAPEALLALLSARLLIDAGLLGLGWRRHPGSRIARSLTAWWDRWNLRESDLELVDNFDFAAGTDLLGEIHQAQQSEGRRARSGIYYTPFTPVGSDETIPPGRRVCDPCCGSGALLWSWLSPDADSAEVFAFDIDETALRICEVNAALFFRDPDHRVTLRRRNHLTRYPRRLPEAPFDWIVTNPPWGARCALPDAVDSFELAVLNSFKLLKTDGELRVLLPGAFLNIKRHARLRRRLLERGTVTIHRQISGFPGVMSSPVLVASSPRNAGTLTLHQAETTHTFSPAAPEYRFTLDAAAGTPERRILDKIDAAGGITLRDNAVFGLGIVTGDNRRLLLQTPHPGAEPVWRGRDIQPFRLTTPDRFLYFTREKFQQCAPESLLRQPKIIYRFIARRPICAIDRGGILTLNSANFFIPGVPGMSWEALTALLNSEIYAFVFLRRCPTLKILRRHLEALPLPYLSATATAELTRLHDECAAGGSTEELDLAVARLFKISENELEFIIEHNRAATNGES